MSDKRELHETRLATTDEKGDRVFIFPEDIKGFWRDWRSIFYWLLISIYLILPWIKVNGLQAILLNLPNREFILFGHRFWGHDAPYFFFFLAGWVFFFAFITSIGGRLWCGWGCPQTVFIDRLYRVIERIVEGPARKRKKLSDAPMSLDKFFRTSLKWFLYLLVSLGLSHCFLAYFIGTDRVFHIITLSPFENWTSFLVMSVVTTIILLDFGWFREQFCIIACPYGRLQSVLMDSNSLVVGYDYNRGEPRKAKDIPKDKQGDCVNCFQCVAACPTGIDIRRGTQLECIACTACIDACDNIMTRLKKPKGLIRYTSENILEGKKTNFFGIRTFVYFGFFIGLVSVGSYFISQSGNLKVVYLRGGGSPYRVAKTDAGEEIINHYRLEFRYKKNDQLKLSFTSDSISDGLKIVTPRNPFLLKPDRSNQVANLFLKFPRKGFLHQGRRTIKLEVVDQTGEVLNSKEIPLVGPYN